MDGAARVAFSRRADVELTREDVETFDFEEIPDRIVSGGGLTAFPALVDLGETVALRVFEQRDEALAEHRRGVERLLRRALADKIKQSRRQLPLDRALALQWTPLGNTDALRADIIEGAWRERLAAHELDVRDRGAFEHLRESLARELFPAAIERLALAEAIIAAYAELRPLLTPPLLGFAKANYDDLREQLDELLAPGFVRDLGKSRLAQLPRYLKAMKLRAERLRQDPARDQARMLGVQVYWCEVLKHRARMNSDPLVEELRWLVEELRVSTFAQELRTPEPVSPKRLAKLVESLRG
jgi:ATP-dependent helicase HrpA